MQIIVSDTSCIVDLKRVELLAAIFELPFQFVIPAPLLDYELLTLSSLEKQLMMDLGLTVLDLDSSAMKIAYDHNAQNAALSVYDCLALTLAQTTQDAILFTGDSTLRRKSEELQIETHGVIWALDHLLQRNCCTKDQALTALETWIEDPLVFLPKQELRKRITRLKK